MKKRFLLFFVLCAVACLLAITVGAAGAESDGYGNITTVEGTSAPSVLDPDARVVIKAADGTFYTFPSYYIIEDKETFTWKKNTGVNEILGLNVTAQEMRKYIVRMEIPEGITAINPTNSGGANAFEDAKAILEVTWPSTLTRIGHYAFNRCTSLTTINNFEEVFAGVTQLGENMLNSTAWGIDHLVIPEGITSIPAGAFWETDVRSVTLPSTLVTMGGRCFQGTKVTEVTIPAGVKVMKNHVFAACANLTTVNFAQGCALVEIGEYAFEKTLITSFDFTPHAKSLEIMGDGVLHLCTKLTTVTGFGLLEKLTAVKYNTFKSCPLTNIEIPPNVTSIGSYAYFGHVSEQSVLRIPNGVVSIGDHSFVRNSTYRGGAEDLKIYLPASLETIGGNYNFEYWHFKEMYIPAGVDMPMGFFNATLTKGVVYYFTGANGEINVHQTNNGAFLNAEWVDAKDFAGASPDKNIIVYNYNVCEAFYQGQHLVGEAEMKLISYFADIEFVGVCSVCEIEQVEAEKTISAIFNWKGYSCSQFADVNGAYSVTQCFEVNKSSVNKYIEATGNEFVFGVLATGNASGEAFEPKLGDEKVRYNEFDNLIHEYFEIKVSGITEALINARIVFCAYVIDGGEMSYLDGGVTLAEVTGVSYNELAR